MRARMTSAICLGELRGLRLDRFVTFRYPEGRCPDLHLPLPAMSFEFALR